MTKLVSLDDAVATVEPGHSVSFGGFNLQNKPMAAVRQLIRRQVHDLTIICAAPSSLDVDMLVGAGLATDLLVQSVSAEDFAAIAPCFRRACEAGSVSVVDVDQGVINAGLRASKMGIASIEALAAMGTSSAAHGGRWLRHGQEPFSGRKVTYIRHLRPDVAFVHVAVADTQGRGKIMGSVFNDALLCGAASRVVVTAEHVVSPYELDGYPGTAVSWRDNTVAVAWAPLGAHPAACAGAYGYDGDHINEYCSAVKHNDGFSEYQERTIGNSEDEYTASVGLTKMLALAGGKTASVPSARDGHGE